MKFLIVDTYYPAFLKSIRKSRLTLSKKKYKDQIRYLFSMCFGTSNFYSTNLRKLGHDAEEIIANDEVLQKTWARENSLAVKNLSFLDRLRKLPLAYKFIGRPDWVQAIAIEQIKTYRPDILYVQDLSILNSETLKRCKKYCKLLVGQIASPLPESSNLKEFDLLLTSFPHFVKKIRSLGVKSEYFKIGFEPGVIKKIGKQKRIYDVTFVGGFTPQHAKATRILEQAATKTRIDVWGRGAEFLSPGSPLRKHYHGEAWGLDMYKILAQSKITLNRHISVSDGYANNMRLYEATGMGAMLITDRKKNLNDLFEVGREVVEYSSPDDLIKKIDYFLKHDKERDKIANAGQKRTLASHTYKKRMEELIGIIKKYV